jgi:asparagine synthase (glutamine-hydrolysing)
MRTVVAFSGWTDPSLPVGAWCGTDAAGRPLALAHVGAPVAVAMNEQRTVRAVLAGGIYNAHQLRTSLGGQDAGADDADLVVQLYEKRGVQCVKALRGAFALVVWDERLQRLLLARDHLGLVPLYFAADRGRLAVASALPVLATLPELAGSWDAAALDAFLALGCVPPPGTFYAAIRQLRPGELAVWEEGRLRTQRYWQLTFPERRLVRADVPAMLREQVLDALRMRQAGAASGLLLSGGLGSAALLAVPAGDGGLPVRAYTGGFGDGDDEVSAAALLTTAAGLEHVPMTADPGWGPAVDALLAAHGGPVGGPELAAVQRAAARAREDIGVVLAGLGVDEIFGGSAPVLAAERVRRFRELPGLAREGAQLWTRLTPARWSTNLRGLVHGERLAPLEMYARAVSLLLPEDRAALYTPDTLAILGDSRPWAALTTLFADAVASGAQDTLDAIHHVELTLRLPARAAALGAAAAGLEVRLPLADHRLAQFAASVLPARRANASSRALLLREALSDRLPGAVVRRPHATSVPPRGSWKELFGEILWPGRIAAQGFFRHDAVARLCEEHLSGRRDHTARLWAITLATRWLDRQALPAIPDVRAAG